MFTLRTCPRVPWLTSSGAGARAHARDTHARALSCAPQLRDAWASYARRATDSNPVYCSPLSPSHSPRISIFSPFAGAPYRDARAREPRGREIAKERERERRKSGEIEELTRDETRRDETRRDGTRRELRDHGKSRLDSQYRDAVYLEPEKRRRRKPWWSFLEDAPSPIPPRPGPARALSRSYKNARTACFRNDVSNSALYIPTDATLFLYFRFRTKIHSPSRPFTRPFIFREKHVAHNSVFSREYFTGRNFILTPESHSCIGVTSPIYICMYFPRENIHSVWKRAEH